MVLTVIFIGALIVGSVLTFVALGAASPFPWLFLVAIAAVVFWTRHRERSTFAEWKDEYSVGIAMIDEDHRKLVKLINKFQTAVFYHTGRRYEEEALNELVDYTKTHFAREEHLMRKHHYPEFEPHKKQHEEMIEEVEKFIARHRQEGHKSLAAVANFLRDWLINHINGTDKKYSAHLRSKGER